MRNRNSMLVFICIVALFVTFPLLADESHHCTKAKEATCCKDKTECCKSADATCCEEKTCGVDAKCCRDKDGAHSCSMAGKDPGTSANTKCSAKCCEHSCCKETKN